MECIKFIYACIKKKFFFAHIIYFTKSLNTGNTFMTFSLRTSETNYLNESFNFYSAIRQRGYYSRASKEER